ncbi:MAG: tetratricopeptide repeat protein, partial [Planctomycetota bacterium]
LDFAIYGLNAPGFHITNIVFHILVCIFIYVLALRLSGNLPFSLAASLIFAVHPLHVESVTWLAGRKDVLFGAFYFLSLLMWNAQGRVSEPWRKVILYLATFVFFVLSCTSKAMGITLPAALLLHDWLLLRPRPEGWKRRLLLPRVKTAPFFLFLVLFAKFVVVPIASNGLIRGWYGGSFGTTFLSVINLLRTYIIEIFLPGKLQAVVDFPLTHTLDIPTILSGIFLVGLLGAGIAILVSSLFREEDPSPFRRLVSFAVLFFFAAISPASNLLFPIQTLYAERYLYLPLLGGPLLLGAAFARAMTTRERDRSSRSAKILAGIGLAGILLVFGGKTLFYNRVWKDDITLWGDVLEKTEGFHHTAHYSRGIAIMLRASQLPPPESETLLERAGEHFRTATQQVHISYFYDLSMAHVALSKVLELRGDRDGAVREIERALAFNEERIRSAPNAFIRGKERLVRSEMYLNLAAVYRNLGGAEDSPLAEGVVRKAVAILDRVLLENPEVAKWHDARGRAHYVLGNIESVQGKDPEGSYRRAIAGGSEALLLSEDLRVAYVNRGRAFFSLANTLGKRGEDVRNWFQSTAVWAWTPGPLSAGPSPTRRKPSTSNPTSSSPSISAGSPIRASAMRKGPGAVTPARPSSRRWRTFRRPSNAPPTSTSPSATSARPTCALRIWTASSEGTRASGSKKRWHVGTRSCASTPHGGKAMRNGARCSSNSAGPMRRFGRMRRLWLWQGVNPVP